VERTRESVVRTDGSDEALAALERFGALTAGVARRTFGTLTEPLLSRAEFRRLVDDEAAWEAVFERPLSDALERDFESDVVRGIVATDALIGTFAGMDDPQLRQNRCFLYHVIGNGTGRWDVPVGCMGALSGALRSAAVAAGAELRVGTPVVAIDADGRTASVRAADGRVFEARHVLAGVAPSVLAGLLGDPDPPTRPEGSQLKLNMLLSRLPRLRDRAVTSEEAFAGTFHVNEGYEQLARAHAEAVGGQIPELPPCEAYCHSLTDASILAPELRLRRRSDADRVRPSHAGATVPRGPRGGKERGGQGHAALDRLGPRGADRGLRAARAGRRAVPRGPAPRSSSKPSSACPAATSSTAT